MPLPASRAATSTRHEPAHSLDDFPTPPWATRALLTHVLRPLTTCLPSHTVLEPACGRGHMAMALREFFWEVQSSDIFDYGYGAVSDFLAKPYDDGSAHWVITNPPFNLSEEFVKKGLRIAREGVAIFARTSFVESRGRYERLFRDTPPSIVAQFVERVPLIKGRISKAATTTTSYCWLVWANVPQAGTRLVWIPPCRKELEQMRDYVVAPTL